MCTYVKMSPARDRNVELVPSVKIDTYTVCHIKDLCGMHSP